MTTRIYRIGSIYTRVEGLIKKKHLTEENKPIWFDVYKRFPPKYEPIYSRKAPEIEIREIFYKEDALRAKIHEKFGRRLTFPHLVVTEPTFSQRLLKTCEQYIAEGMSENEALNKLEDTFARNESIDKKSNQEVSIDEQKESISDVKENV